MPFFPDASTGSRLAGIAAIVLSSTLVCAGPVIPGLDRLSDDATTSDAFVGEILLGELNCIQCHTTNDAARIWTKKAPDLRSVGARVTPQYLRRFVTSPAGAKPGTTMPNIFHASNPDARDGAVEFLTHFLVSLGGPIAPSRHGDIEGSVTWGKELFHSVGCVACHGPQDEAAATGYKPLGDLAAKTTVDALTTFLLNPHEVRPSGRMPSLWLSNDEARAISVYLLREQRDNPQEGSASPALLPGLHVDYYELNSIESIADVPRTNPTKPRSKPSPSTYLSSSALTTMPYVSRVRSMWTKLGPTNSPAPPMMALRSSLTGKPSSSPTVAADKRDAEGSLSRRVGMILKSSILTPAATARFA